MDRAPKVPAVRAKEGPARTILGERLRRTKIVCTLGPSTDSERGVEGLVRAGMDVARLNFSHGNRESHRKTIRLVRRVSARLGKETGILQDLGGPKIRLGNFEDEGRILAPGEQITLVPGSHAPPPLIPVSYDRLTEDVAVGDSILLSDGSVLLHVVEKEAQRVLCRVVVGGPIQSRKGVNLPASTLRTPAFTEKDRQDLVTGLEEGVDFVALSFVRHESDLEPILKALEGQDDPPLLIAKIEKPQAVGRLKEILARVDGMMVARGDLGVEMPLEEVPMIQKEIIRVCRRSGKPVITATQMLRSMIESPRPTRAEAADAANAVLDGTDAVMLSEETAVGSYPEEAVRVLARIAVATERHMDGSALMEEPVSEMLPPTASAISRAACWLARDLQASAIVAATTSGSTARLVARFRQPFPVVALSHRLPTVRQLAMSWGVIPQRVEAFSEIDHMVALGKTRVLQLGLGGAGDRLIVTAGIPPGVPGTTNLLKVVEMVPDFSTNVPPSSSEPSVGAH